MILIPDFVATPFQMLVIVEVDGSEKFNAAIATGVLVRLSTASFPHHPEFQLESKVKRAETFVGVDVAVALGAEVAVGVGVGDGEGGVVP